MANPLLIRDDLVFNGICLEDTELSLRLATREEIAAWKKQYGRTIMIDEFGPRDGDDEMLGLALLAEGQ